MNNAKLILIATVFGLCGMGIFQVSSCAYADLSFLHQARVLSEQPRPPRTPPPSQPAPTPAPQATPAPQEKK